MRLNAVPLSQSLDTLLALTVRVPHGAPHIPDQECLTSTTVVLRLSALTFHRKGGQRYAVWSARYSGRLSGPVAFVRHCYRGMQEVGAVYPGVPCDTQQWSPAEGF